MNMSPIIGNYSNIMASLEKTSPETAPKDFEEMLIEEIFGESLVPDMMMSAEDIDESDEENDDFGSNAQNELYTQMMSRQISVSLAKQDVFGLGQYLQRIQAKVG